MRLIGRQVGALVCALYASKHPEKVDSLFLLEPVREVATGLEARDIVYSCWSCGLLLATL